MDKHPFEYQKPTDGQVGLIQDIRRECRILYELIQATPMDGRSQALARTKLQEVFMWCSAGIVLKEPEAAITEDG